MIDSLVWLQRPVKLWLDHASCPLGEILNSYTVYFDLVLCDREGRVVANGRPDQYQSVGVNLSGEGWFRDAINTSAGDSFAFKSVHRSKLVADQQVLTYSAAVREGGHIDGRPLGVLGILFDWDSLAQTIVDQTPIADDERATTRCLIADQCGTVLDAPPRNSCESKLATGVQEIVESAESDPKGFPRVVIDSKDHCVAYAKSPGYETYATGWNSVIIQPYAE